MANATILRSEMSLDGHGQRGKREIRGTASWPTTNATCTLPCRG
jgi:hypothetical protein